MSYQPGLIVQLPRGGAVERQLTARAPQSVVTGQVVVEVGPTGGPPAGSGRVPRAVGVVLAAKVAVAAAEQLQHSGHVRPVR
jgi:hypothetical protein